MKIETYFDLEKETKGTFRYKEIVEDDDEPVIGTLYIKKSAIDGKAPKSITVIIKL